MLAAPARMSVKKHLTSAPAVCRIMIKKLLLATMVVLGLVYGSGENLSSVKRMVTSASNENARGLTGNSHDGWGAGSGY
jgi:hypothetical protein